MSEGEKELKTEAQQLASNMFQQWKQMVEGAIRKDAIRRSQVTSIGKITEHFAPFLPGFKYNPKDARFIESPVDFIVFDGISEGQLRDIVFIEVKTGESTLSPREQQVKDAVHLSVLRHLSQCSFNPETFCM